jgi:Zn finger protein HypA/HybF involved in hydrogenase expression
MVREDPYPRSTARRYECRSCLSVVVAEERVTDCPECGGRVKNVSVPRE